MMPEPPRLPIVEGIADALPVPPEVSEAPGVAFAAAVASLPAGKRGGLISVFEVTPEGVTRVNAAIVHKVGEHSTVSAWIGKEWGGARDGVSYGVAWRTTW
jgi:hypothetical protein